MSLRETQTLKIEDTRTKCRVVCNLSVVELLLNEKEESLEHAKDSLRLAQKTKDREYIACTYGNIGLAYEYMGKYKEAIKPYEECLRLGKEATNYRVINNGLCNLGRAYQGIGDVEEAKKYFMQAIETLRPSKAFWCDTEDFRFSGDYLLAKLVLLNENNSDEAAKQFIEVIKRCETLRKRIQDSPIKITFNDTQRKPYQYLQHILLESGKGNGSSCHRRERTGEEITLTNLKMNYLSKQIPKWLCQIWSRVKVFLCCSYLL